MTHSAQAALRGEPSYVWRAGQERRLEMVAQWTQVKEAMVLVDGCGLGMYASQLRRRFDSHVEALDVELERVGQAQEEVPHAVVAVAEKLPYPANTFDTVLSHEVIEHVMDDRQSVAEIVRVLKPGGRVVIFLPNRWYPFETHGHYWKGEYHFGNTPLINYLPDRWRDQLAPHVRAYTRRQLFGLFDGLPVRLVHHQRVYGGYDNIIARLGRPAVMVRDFLYQFEDTLMDTWGLSHFLVMEKTQDRKNQ